ncbi:MAG: SDR family oxidoreductase [Xanthomonadales bacterium]|nr:SDR family oxidoreductase [Xanthomonadales bacterium]
MDLSLKGLHALVGGGSRGIGRAAALELARNGAAVTLVARNEATLKDALDGLDSSRGQVHGFIAADSGDPAKLAESVARIASQRPIHIFINNTGGPPDGPAHTADPDEYLAAFRQHLLSSQAVLQVLLPGMRQRGYGRIINVISTSVKQPIPGLGVSNTIRGAVASWAKTLAGELGPDGITVNNVLPGFTETDRLEEVIRSKAARTGGSEADIAEAMRQSVPLRRFGKPEETAAAIAFLASPAAAYISGVNLPVDGGRTGSL